MTISTIKFSQFSSGGDLANADVTVGYGGGSNLQFNNPWTFLPEGTTGDRPVPAADNYYRLRLNTTLRTYEYYDPISATWTELSGSGTGTVNPGVVNDIAFYPANGTALSPIAAAANAVLVTSAGMVPSLSTTLPSGLSIPGATITSSTAALTSGQVAAVPVNPTDLVNKTYVDTAIGGDVTSITGTTNQVIASSPTGAVTLSLPQDIATGSSPTFAGMTLSATPLNGASGGTGQSTYTLGDMLYSSAANTLSKLAGNITAVKQYLSQTGTGAVSAAPVWATISGADVTGAALTKTDDTNVTLTLGGSPTTALLNAASITAGWTGTLAISRGGTGVGSVTTAPTASAWAGWDANSNLSANAFIEGFASTATVAGTTTLTVASKQTQEFTGATTQTVVMPVTSTLVAGMKWMIINNSSGNLTVNSSGGNLILTMAANTTAWITCVLNSGTTAASWNSSYLYDLGAGVLSITGTADQVIASASTGAVTLSLPQSIGTSSAVQFASLRLSNTGLLDNNNVTMMTLGAIPSAVNYFAMSNAATAGLPAFQVLGSDTNITMQILGKGTGGVLIRGTGTNDNAVAGFVGEYVTNSAGPTGITTATATTITSISLTAGDWDVFGSIRFTGGGGTIATDTIVSVSLTNNTLGSAPFTRFNTTFTAGALLDLPSPFYRVSIASTTTVYLIAQSTFTVSTNSCTGYIFARRVR